jgi:capsular exopolysaccharide synthesis family protein
VAESQDTLRLAASERPAPVLGPSPRGTTAVHAIPRDREGAWQARAVLVDRQGVSAASFQRFAWKVRRALEARGARSVVVTSAVRDEGKTITACNLALALASLGRGRVALVDLDLRSPSVAHALGLPVQVGIESCLAHRVPLREVRIETDLHSLDVFPARAARPDAHEVLGAQELREVLAELRRSYELLVVDTPPVLPVPDTPLLLQDVESCVCVARAGRTQPSALQQALELLPRDKVLGLFLNAVRSQEPSDRYVYYDRND